MAAWAILKPFTSALFSCRRTHNMMNSEWRCEICTFIYSDCGRLPAKPRGRSFTNHFFFQPQRRTKLPQVYQIVSIGKLSSPSRISVLISPCRRFCSSLLPVNTRPWWHWKTHHLLASHSCMFNTRTWLLREKRKSIFSKIYAMETAFCFWGLFFLCLRFEPVSK